MVASSGGENKEFERQLPERRGGSRDDRKALASRIRAGGVGLGGFFTPRVSARRIAEAKRRG